MRGIITLRKVKLMGRDVVSAKLDIIFKKIFTENEDMLHSFVSSMLDIPPESIDKITVTNPERILNTIRIMEKKSAQKLAYMWFCAERFP